MRAKNILVMTVIVLPLLLIGVFQYASRFRQEPWVATISILPPHNYGPKQYDRLVDEIPIRFGEILSSTPGLKVRRTPLPIEVGQADRDLVKLSNTVGGADALVMPTITVDEAIVDLTVEVVDSRTKHVLYNETFEGPSNRVDDMVRAAGDALKRNLRP